MNIRDAQRDVRTIFRGGFVGQVSFQDVLISIRFFSPARRDSERQRRDREIKYLTRRAYKFGYQLLPVLKLTDTP
ncbi:MAG TPA: hypothetical protein VMP08_10855 [Anaerolineae bacterium]|nr:hypothetical protein [Anaerolineae bacterium]